MEDYELMLFDRKEVIRKTIAKYGEENFFISFSGGKDSTVLSHLIDEAIPGNTIPRVFINTGIEFTAMLQHIRELAEHDSRIVIYNSRVNVKKMLEENGYPFKSKEFARNVAMFDRSGVTKTVYYYMNGLKHNGEPSSYKCPKKLKYVFPSCFRSFISVYTKKRKMLSTCIFPTVKI